MVAKLAEGETPDIDPAECSSSQSFSTLMTKALKEGNFNYTDPSSLLKKMTQHENSRVKAVNKGESKPEKPSAKIIHLPPVKQEPPRQQFIPVIYFENGKEVSYELPIGMYETLLSDGALEVTLFGVYARKSAPMRKRA